MLIEIDELHPTVSGNVITYSCSYPVLVYRFLIIEASESCDFVEIMLENINEVVKLSNSFDSYATCVRESELTKISWQRIVINCISNKMYIRFGSRLFTTRFLLSS